jgi:hypothetical protein
MSFTQATKYGTGVGKIYLTTFNNQIIANFKNNKAGKEQADKMILASSPVIGETLALATITYTAGAGDVTNLTIGGVSIFNISIPIVGASLSQLAINTALAINSFTSTPNYTAQAIGDSVYIFIQAGFGSSLNGSVVAATVTGTLDFTKTDLDGGTSAQDIVDAQTGIKVFVNDSPTAQDGTIVGATDITQFVVRKPYNSPLDIRSYTISGGAINIERKGTLTEIKIDTEGSASADDLTDIIAAGFSNGDTLIVRGLNSARVTTMLNTGNLQLANSNSFLTGDNDNVIYFQFINGNFWEVLRSPNIPLSVSAFRAANFPQEVLGYKDIALTSGGGTINLEPGVDEKYIRITGSPVTLSSSWTIQGVGTPKQGDTFIVYFDQQVTIGANSITIFGIPLTALQASSSPTSGNKVVVIGEFVDGWRGTLIANLRGRDVVDTTQLAAKENLLGNPSIAGYVLSSDTLGNRAWVPQSQLNFASDRIRVRKRFDSDSTIYLEKSTDNLVGGSMNNFFTGYTETLNASGVLAATFDLATGVFTVPVSGYYYISHDMFLRFNTDFNTTSLKSSNSNMLSQRSKGYWMERQAASSPILDFAITAVSTGSNTVTIVGDQTTLFVAGKEFFISGSTGNNGLYTTLSSSFSGGNTIITVNVPESDSGITNATADGNINALVVTRTGKLATALTQASSSQIMVFTCATVVTDKTGRANHNGNSIIFLNSGQQYRVAYINSTDLTFYGVNFGGTNINFTLDIIKLAD